MNLEKVIFAFFIILSLTLNFGFFIGDINDQNHHHVYELYAALVVSIIATILKFGDRSHLGAVVLASSLVADIQLIAAAVIWGLASQQNTGIDSSTMASIVSLAGGALVANTISVILLISETMVLRR